MYTIAAVATPPGEGGIGIVRLSGEQARAIADQVFTAANGKSLAQIPGYTCLFGAVQDASGAFDQCVATNFRAPKSYTGEDVVELSCHGGPYLLQRLLQACIACGARLAMPGEFTRRAFLNGKMDLAAAESVMESIGARNNAALRAARAAQDGRLQQQANAVRKILVEQAAHLAAWADFPEEDVPQVQPEQLCAALRAALGKLDAMLSGFASGRLLREGVDVVIAGRPNVGKSTLMNLLSGCERSIVTDVPGTTRDVVEDTVVLDGIPLHLADTAGLRATSDPVEQLGVSRARDRVRKAQLVLAVFDASVPLAEEDRGMLSLIKEAPAIAIINKSDLPIRTDEKWIQEHFTHFLYTDARAGKGVQALSKAIRSLLHAQVVDPSAGVLFTQRQLDCARRAHAALQEALSALQAGLTLDAVTVGVESAIAALLELTGERASEQVIDAVFAQFCVGK